MIRFLTIPLLLLSLPPLLAQPVHTDTGQELLFRELCYVGSFEERTEDGDWVRMQDTLILTQQVIGTDSLGITPPPEMLAEDEVPFQIRLVQTSHSLSMQFNEQFIELLDLYTQRIGTYGSAISAPDMEVGESMFLFLADTAHTDQGLIYRFRLDLHYAADQYDEEEWDKGLAMLYFNPDYGIVRVISGESLEEGEDILDIPETERDEAVLTYAVNHYSQGTTEKIVMRW